MSDYLALAPGAIAEHRLRLCRRYWAALAAYADDSRIALGVALAEVALPLTAELVAAGRLSEHARAQILEELLPAVAGAESDEHEFSDPIWHEVVLAGWV